MIHFLPQTQEIPGYYQKIISQKLRVGTQDSKIAVITLSRQAIVVTRSNRDFVKVPDLQIEDWSI
jgi:tRNA(fMet)-specific endonuclease VapC